MDVVILVILDLRYIQMFVCLSEMIWMKPVFSLTAGQKFSYFTVKLRLSPGHCFNYF